MIHRPIVIALIALMLPLPLRAQTTMEANIDPDRAVVSRTELSRRVDFSIRRAVKYLLSRQNVDGSWTYTDEPASSDGYTALVTLALLSSGESHQSQAITRAVSFLKKARPDRTRHATYAIGLRAAVYALLPEPLRKEELKADLRWLQGAVNKTGPMRGMYDYGGIASRGGDYSNSQYGVLGVWYAAAAGLEVPKAYWKSVEDGWLMGQNADGGWGYRPDRPNSYGSMTAAAIATLLITHDYLHANDSMDLSRRVENKPINAAMQWLNTNFAVDHNPLRDTPRRQRNDGPAAPGLGNLLDLIGEAGGEVGFFVHYMLFGYERVGEASGLTRFGNHRWYDLGAEYLLRTQQYEGYWNGSIGTEGDTAYALLFLSRGRAPVVIQKLAFEGRWDNRSRDASAFVRFMRRATERHVNWQIVSINEPIAQLREAPLLYIASDRALPLSSEQKRKLQTYVEQGGLIVAANEGRGKEFVNSVIEMGKELWPQYGFRDLPADHLVYTANFPANRATEPIQALSNGVREFIILYPTGDMSWKWLIEGGGFSPRSTPYATLANTWLYATDRANPRFKGEDSWIDRNDGVVVERSTSVARIRHESNWDSEPGGWARLANVMHNFDQLDINVEPVGVARGQSGDAEVPTTRPTVLDPKRHIIAHLSATKAVQMSPEMKQMIKRYIDDGGLLVMDAAGGSPEAGGSFDLFLRELYPNVLFGNMKLDHPIYNAATHGGQILKEVTYRRSQTLASVRIPRLRGAVIGTKLIAILSAEDISGGLVGYNTAGLTGYSPASATDLMRNIILWRASALR